MLAESDDAASSWRFDDGEPLPFQGRSLLPAKMRKMSRETMVLGAKTPGISLMLIRSFPVRALRYRATFVGPSRYAHRHRCERAQRKNRLAAVKRAGVEFAIIRCGYGQDHESQHDDRWLDNVRGATAAGIPYGVYLYSYADTVAKAKGEAWAILFACCGRATASPSSPFTTIWRNELARIFEEGPLLGGRPSRSARK